jgi:hypothetical protein
MQNVLEIYPIEKTVFYIHIYAPNRLVLFSTSGPKRYRSLTEGNKEYLWASLRLKFRQLVAREHHKSKTCD